MTLRMPHLQGFRGAVINKTVDLSTKSGVSGGAHLERIDFPINLLKRTNKQTCKTLKTKTS